MAKRTTTEAELRAMAQEGLTFAGMAIRVGFTSNAVRHACDVLGIEVSKGRGTSALPLAAYVEDMRAGLTLEQIAIKHGKASPTTIHHALKRAGLPTCLRALLRAESSPLPPSME